MPTCLVFDTPCQSTWRIKFGLWLISGLPTLNCSGCYSYFLMHGMVTKLCAVSTVRPSRHIKCTLFTVTRLRALLSCQSLHVPWLYIKGGECWGEDSCSSDTVGNRSRYSVYRDRLPTVSLLHCTWWPSKEWQLWSLGEVTHGSCELGSVHW